MLLIAITRGTIPFIVSMKPIASSTLKGIMSNAGVWLERFECPVKIHEITSISMDDFCALRSFISVLTTMENHHLMSPITEQGDNTRSD